MAIIPHSVRFVNTGKEKKSKNICRSDRQFYRTDSPFAVTLFMANRQGGPGDELSEEEIAFLKDNCDAEFNETTNKCEPKPMQAAGPSVQEVYDELSADIIRPKEQMNFDDADKKASEKFDVKGTDDFFTGGYALEMSGDNEGKLAINTKAKREKAKASVFGGVEEKKHDTANGKFTTDGTFDGAEGTFECMGTNETCISQDGEPKGDMWTFTPDDPDAKETITAEWGWWWSYDADADDKKLTGQVFRDSGDFSPSSALNLLGEGTATYTGDALGLYSIPGEAGNFTATATLTATFGGDENPKLKGMIDNFSNNSDWKVELKELTAADPAGSFTKSDFAEVGTWEEVSWSADMYNGTAAKKPDTILGDFKATAQGSVVVGAFGAQE